MNWLNLSLRRGDIGWIQEDGEFRLMPPSVVGDLAPDALVKFDRDLAETVWRPVFAGRWGYLYIGCLSDPDVCWCWNSSLREWEDLSGGRWHPQLDHEWRSFLLLACAHPVTRDTG